MSEHDHSNLFVFSGANKAGMADVNKEKQAKIIYESSKNSAYFIRAAVQDAKVKSKVEIMLRDIQSMTPREIAATKSAVIERMTALELTRNLTRIRCVIDMDMFYAAVEIRDNPSLSELPIAVGGNSMISTTNYVARKFGVRSAMPGFIGKKLCPQLVFVEPNFQKYQIVANQIREIIAEYDSNFESYSLDEVYFDITAAVDTRIREMPSDSNFNSENSEHSIQTKRIVASKLLSEIRERITAKTGGLTCSAGMANNFSLAKICADINKPNGQYELPPLREHILSFLTTLPTRKIGGIGKVTENILAGMGMHTMGEVRERLHELVHVLTPITALFLIRRSIGIDDDEGRSIRKERDKQKSMGAERTFSTISAPEELNSKLWEISQLVAAELKQHEISGRRITLKLKTIQFELFTRCVALRSYIHSAKDIYTSAIPLLRAMLPISVRLMGISISKLKLPDGNPMSSDDSEVDHHGHQSIFKYFSKATASSENINTNSLKEDNVDSNHNSERLLLESTEIESPTDVVNVHAPSSSSSVRTSPPPPTVLRPPPTNHRTSSTATMMRATHKIEFQEQSQVSKVLDYTCPSCGSAFSGSLAMFNAHLDECLVNGTPTCNKVDKTATNSTSSSGSSVLRKSHETIRIWQGTSYCAVGDKRALNTYLITGVPTTLTASTAEPPLKIWKEKGPYEPEISITKVNFDSDHEVIVIEDSDSDPYDCDT